MENFLLYYTIFLLPFVLNRSLFSLMDVLHGLIIITLYRFSFPTSKSFQHVFHKNTKITHIIITQLLNNTILLKREDTQPVFSFKIRGAYNKMASLSAASLSRGVVACSAGNHAQGVALSARRLGCRAVICMPLATPSIKVNAVRAHGGETVEVRLFGNNYDEAAGEARRLEKEEGLAMIHPFDDEDVIAGQGTIGE